MATKRRNSVSKKEKKKTPTHSTQCRQYFALLHPGCISTKAIDIECEDDSEQRLALCFTPCIDVSEYDATLGIVAVNASLPDITLSRLSSVKLVNKSNVDNTIHVIADTSKEIEKWPAPKRNGFFKAFQSALSQLHSDPLLTHRLWLSQQFVVKGFAFANALTDVMVKCDEKSKSWPTSVAKTDNLWIWRDAQVKWAEKLAKEIEHRKQRNCYIDEVHSKHVLEWLKIEQPELIEHVLKTFASKINKRVKRYPDGIVVAIDCGLLSSPHVPAEANVASTILTRYSAGEGLSISALGKAYPSHKHVIAALVEARHLLEGPDEWVFTRRQLRSYFKKLKAHSFKEGVPSVRQIKDFLDLERRQAEALRAYLEINISPDKPSKRRTKGRE